MRIVQLVTRRQRRGAEVFAADLSEALVGRGHAVRYAGLTAPPAEPLVPAGVPVDDVGSRGGPLSLPLVRALAAYLRRHRPDVVQANGGFAMKYAALAARWDRAPAPILYCNIGLSSDWLRRPGQRLWTGWLLRHAAATAAVSEATRGDLIRTYGLAPERVRVVRRGVRFAPSAPAALAEVPEGAFVVLHVGSFAPEKNHAGLLRIVDRVRGGVARDVHLVLVGDGPLRTEVERAAGAHVHVLGLRDDVPALMAAADVLLLPSLTEGIPGVVLEAAAQGVPTVAYDVGGVGEVVVDGKTGRLTDAGDEAAAAEAVRRLAGAPARLAALGDGARRLVRERYSLERSADRFLDLYCEIAPAA